MCGCHSVNSWDIAYNSQIRVTISKIVINKEKKT